LAWRPFFVSGELLHDMELRLTAQKHEEKLGVHIITPFKRLDTGYARFGKSVL
jgi:cytochrome oxidase assembly protein ShyY1